MFLLGIGLKIGIAAGVVAAHAASVQDQKVPDWTCQRDMRGPGDQLLYFRRFLSPEGVHQSYFIGYRASSSRQREQTTIYWSFQNPKRWRENLQAVILEFEVRNSPERGDITAEIFGDGKFILKEKVLDDAWARQHGNQRIGGTISFYVPYIPSKLVITNMRSLKAIVRDSDNNIIVRASFSLPDWRRADQFVMRTVEDLQQDSADYKNRWGQQGGVIRELPIVDRPSSGRSSE
jgi:hypothetical protein